MLAERGGFEPPIGLHLCRISSAVHSTALPPLQRGLRFSSPSTHPPALQGWQNRVGKSLWEENRRGARRVVLRRVSSARERFEVSISRRVALGFVFLWFFIGGIAHFAFTSAEMRIVPPALPAPRALVLISGVFELLGAAGLLLARTRSAAGWGLIALTIAVTPANIFMLQQADRYPMVPYWALILRLPLQLVLLFLIWWSTRPVPRASA
jgi:uncharacterized membrane protein